MRTVPVPVDKIVQTTSNDGGYLGGTCLLCGASGVTSSDTTSSRYGYPTYVQKMVDGSGKRLVMGNRLFHKSGCPMNAMLNSKGELA